MTKNNKLRNFINGQWQAADTNSYLDVVNPATAVTMIQVPLSPVETVATAVTEAIAEAAATRRVGYGLDDGVQMGPVQRLERDLLWRSARSGAARRGILYADQSGGRAPAAPLEPPILRGFCETIIG